MARRATRTSDGKRPVWPKQHRASKGFEQNKQLKLYLAIVHACRL